MHKDPLARKVKMAKKEQLEANTVAIDYRKKPRSVRTWAARIPDVRPVPAIRRFVSIS
jgi:hypothetical protein